MRLDRKGEGGRFATDAPTIQPWLNKLERTIEHISPTTVGPRSVEVARDVDALLRGDMLSGFRRIEPAL